MVAQHIQRHAVSYAMKELQKQQQAQMAAAQQMMGGAAMGGNGAGAPNQAAPGPGPSQPGAGPAGGMNPSRYAMPQAPGRLPQTANEGDLQRQMPREQGPV
jgi:hypothetical protein